MKKYAFLLFVGYISFSSSMEDDRNRTNQNLSSSMKQFYDPKTKSITFDHEIIGSGSDFNDRSPLSHTASATRISDLNNLPMNEEYQRFFNDTELEAYEIIDKMYEKPQAELFKNLFHKLTKMEVASIRAINTEINTQLNKLSSRIDAIHAMTQRNEQKNIDLEKNKKRKTAKFPLYKSFLFGSVLTNIVLTSTLLIRYLANEG